MAVPVIVTSGCLSLTLLQNSVSRSPPVFDLCLLSVVIFTDALVSPAPWAGSQSLFIFETCQENRNTDRETNSSIEGPNYH